MSDDVKAPDRIRVAQDTEGFWTCREAVSGSQEYVRADLFDTLMQERDEARAERDNADQALQRIGMVLGTSDEWTSQENMIACVEGAVAALRARLTAAQEALSEAHAFLSSKPKNNRGWNALLNRLEALLPFGAAQAAKNDMEAVLALSPAPQPKEPSP